MNEYEVRFFTGTSRYERKFYVGRIKAGTFMQAALIANERSIRQGRMVASVTLIFSE